MSRSVSMTATFIGGGNMATAMIGGMIARGRSVADFRIVEPLAAARDRLSERYKGVQLFAECTQQAIAGANLVILAVKPQQMRLAAAALAPQLADSLSTIVLSIAAGIRIVDLSRWLEGRGRLVRAMPNTPALIGKGISGVFASSDVDTDGRVLVSTVLEAAGELLWVDDEAMLDAVTGVSGSGPAYVFYFIEALEAAALGLGFRASDARRLAYGTFEGAVALAQATPVEPAQLRAQVTSKGGTTERALSLLQAEGVKERIIAAVRAASERAGEMGDEFGRDS